VLHGGGSTLSVNREGTFITGPSIPHPVPWVTTVEEQGGSNLAAAKKLNLGKNLDEDTPVEIKLATMKKHVVAFGASGSGKTVCGKVFIEEISRNKIPSIIVDPQGDLASLIMASHEDEVDYDEHPELTPEMVKEFREKTEVRIFTPASDKGLPLSINPLKPLPPGLDHAEHITTIDQMAGGLCQILDYNLKKDDGKSAKSYMNMLLTAMHDKEIVMKDFKELADFVYDPSKLMKGADLKTADRLMAKGDREKLGQRLISMTIGANKLLFNYGTAVDIDTFMKPVEKGKTPINVVYLNTLTDEAAKQFFLLVISREIYNWMLSNPSKNVQLFYYIDEVAPYLPPMKSPPPKETIMLLFKQARKYGVSLMIASQNFSDVDYKIAAQCNTKIIGRLGSNQDREKMKKTLAGEDPRAAERIVNQLQNVSAGQFSMLCPDEFDEPVNLQTRWLLHAHETLDEDMVADLVPDEQRAFFKKLSGKSKPKAKMAEPEPEPAEEESPEVTPGDDDIPEVVEEKPKKGGKKKSAPKEEPKESLSTTAPEPEDKGKIKEGKVLEHTKEDLKRDLQEDSKRVGKEARRKMSMSEETAKTLEQMHKEDTLTFDIMKGLVYVLTIVWLLGVAVGSYLEGNPANIGLEGFYQTLALFMVVLPILQMGNNMMMDKVIGSPSTITDDMSDEVKEHLLKDQAARQEKADKQKNNVWTGLGVILTFWLIMIVVQIHSYNDEPNTTMANLSLLAAAVNVIIILSTWTAIFTATKGKEITSADIMRMLKGWMFYLITIWLFVMWLAINNGWIADNEIWFSNIAMLTFAIYALIIFSQWLAKMKLATSSE